MPTGPTSCEAEHVSPQADAHRARVCNIYMQSWSHRSQTDTQSTGTNTDCTNGLRLLPSLAEQDGDPLAGICVCARVYTHTYLSPYVQCGSLQQLGSDTQSPQFLASGHMSPQGCSLTPAAGTHHRVYTPTETELASTPFVSPIASSSCGLTLKRPPCSQAISPIHQLVHFDLC